MVMRWLLRLSLMLMLTLSAILFYFYVEYQSFNKQELNLPETGMTVLFQSGMSYPAMIKKLEAQGVTHFDWRWRVLGRLHQQSYQAGEYHLEPGLKPLDLLNRLHQGRVFRHQFTIIEGWTVAQLRQALAELPRLRIETTDWDQARLSKALGIVYDDTITAPLEGWFLPETYDYGYGDSDFDLLQRAHRAMLDALNDVWQSRDPSLPYQTPLQLLTMASIVEKETAVADERAQVAGVFVRRLQKGMRLQTDPTIIYGLGASFDGNLKRIHLRTDNPYNTYTRHGLPPTPIALPGRAALEAAVAPADGNSLFFVATGDGRHVFSANLAEHERNVDRYQRRRR